MLNQLSPDQASNLKLKYRKGEGKRFKITCLDTNGDPFDLTDYEFELDTYYIYDKGTNIFTLSEGSSGGITNNGVLGTIFIVPEDDQVDLPEGKYEWRLRAISPAKNTWFNGEFEINNSPNTTETLDEIEVTLDLGDQNIVVTINLSGGGGDFDIIEYNDFVADGLPTGVPSGYIAILKITDPNFQQIIDGVQYYANKIIYFDGTKWISWGADYGASS